MKIALAFDAPRQREWRETMTRLNLDAITSVEFVGATSVSELQSAQAEIAIGYASGFFADFLAEAPPTLKWVHFMNAGVDPLAKRLEGQVPHFQVSNVRGIHAGPIAEFVLMCMLHFAKRVPDWIRLQQAHKWRPVQPGLLAGKHVLIVGAGSIGAGIARLCKAFDMTVTGVATRAGARAPFDRIVTSMRDAIADADFVVCSLPLTSETRGVFDTATFALMKPRAVFVNIARGEMVDDAALIEALKSGHLAGAALDAFIEEPLPDSSPLWDAPNLLLTPHVSGRFDGGSAKGAEVFGDNFRCYVAGQPLVTPVDLVRGY